MILAHPRARLGRQLARDLTFTLPGEWVPMLDRLAAEAGMARSNFVRQAVFAAMGVTIPTPEVPA